MRLWLVFLACGSLFGMGQHSLQHISPRGKNIEIEDHSVWYVRKKNRATSSKWREGDALNIYPNLDPFTNTDYPFCIKNITSDAPSILTALKLGPLKKSKNAHWIEKIKSDEQQIRTLSGGCRLIKWLIEEKDLEILATWKPKHGIIIGRNEGLFSWWYSSYKYILINVNTSEWIRVTPLNIP